MLTEKDYCDYDTAWDLCSLGYPEEDWILLYSAQKWMREEKNILVTVGFLMTEEGDWEYEVQNHRGLHKLSTIMYKTYEEALLEGVREAIKLLKEE